MDARRRSDADDLEIGVALLLFKFHVHLRVDGRKFEGQNIPLYRELGGFVVRTVGDQGDQIGFLEFLVLAGGHIVRSVDAADDVGDLAGGIQIIVHQTAAIFTARSLWAGTHAAFSVISSVTAFSGLNGAPWSFQPPK